MSPEQINSNLKSLNFYKCDVFSLGVTLFRLIFKVFPFSPNSYEDPLNSKEANFVDNFISSSRNIF
jgi:serine/threonine protein kinase